MGGDAAEAIPSDAFSELLSKFPNSYEVDRYSDARVHMILEQYLEDMKDARGLYEVYLNKVTPTLNSHLNLIFINELEIEIEIEMEMEMEMEMEEYILIRDAIENALNTKQHWSEKYWQRLIMT